MGAPDRPGILMAARVLAPMVPLLCGFLAVLLSNIPISLVGGLVPPPLLALVPIYYWCLVRPDLMTPAAAFAIGILQDILAGSPPGIWTLSFVLTYVLIDRQREGFAGLSGLGAVLGFAAATLVTCTVAYLVMALLYHAPPLGPMLGELVVTVLFFIPGAFVVGAIHHRLVGAQRHDF